jgi:hypothetical protein
MKFTFLGTVVTAIICGCVPLQQRSYPPPGPYPSHPAIEPPVPNPYPPSFGGTGPPPQTFQIGGFVRDYMTLEGVPAVIVQPFGGSEAAAQAVATRTNGMYMLGPLPGGLWSARCSKPGYATPVPIQFFAGRDSWINDVLMMSYDMARDTRTVAFRFHNNASGAGGRVEHFVQEWERLQRTGIPPAVQAQVAEALRIDPHLRIPPAALSEIQRRTSAVRGPRPGPGPSPGPR